MVDRKNTGNGERSSRTASPTRDVVDDRQAEDFFVKFRAPLTRFFAKRVGADADIDDLVQEVFIRILALNKCEQLQNPDAYIFQIAANLLRDRARRMSTKQQFSRSFAIETGDRVEELSPERVLQGKQSVRHLQRALRELPERTRAVFLLHRFEGFKYKEIAARLNISTSSVEKHMMAAIRHVTDCMDRGNEQD